MVDHLGQRNPGAQVVQGGASAACDRYGHVVAISASRRTLFAVVMTVPSTSWLF